MNHDYKMRDLHFMAKRDDTDLRESVVSFMLDGNTPMPECLIHRLESIINRMISEYEDRTGETILPEAMELEIHLTADTVRGELSLHVYIGYSVNEEFLFEKETFIKKDDDDEEYATIRNFFLQQVIGVFYRQYMRIQGSI